MTGVFYSLYNEHIVLDLSMLMFSEKYLYFIFYLAFSFLKTMTYYLNLELLKILDIGN